MRALIRGPAGAAALEGRRDAADVLARAALASAEPPKARIVLIRAAEAVDLISLRALRRLSEADRIVADPDVNPDLLRLGRRDAPLTRLTPTQALAARTDATTLEPWLAETTLLVRICQPDPQQEYATLSAAGLEAEIIN